MSTRDTAPMARTSGFAHALRGRAEPAIRRARSRRVGLWAADPAAGAASRSGHPRVARFFPLRPDSERQAWKSRRLGNDHAATNRAALSHLRHALQVPAGDLDELVRGEAHRLPRARRRDAAAALS